MKEFKVNEKITLKRLMLDDAKALFDLTDSNREFLKEWLPWLDYNKTVSDSEFFIKTTIKQYEENNGFQTGIWFEDKLCGVIGHHFIDWNNKRTSIGYWLGKDFEKKGIMTLACRAYIEYAFNTQKLNKIEIAAAVKNLKSKAIPERLGFKQEGILREHEWLYDHFVDHAVYSLLREDWILIQ